MIPLIALVGRPNVGKSTIFNKLTQTSNALVANFSGLTHDRQYGKGKLGDYDYVVIDTIGLSKGNQNIDFLMEQQTWNAVLEAHIILFVVDAKSGLTVSDEELVRLLRKKGKSYYLVVNKVDNLNLDITLAEFVKIRGLDNFCVVASHGKGIRSMIDKVLAYYYVQQIDSAEKLSTEGASVYDIKGIKVSVVGRPNVGKSTLVNRIVGEQRVLTHEEAGTTRDSIYVPFKHNNDHYTLIDTAGVRRIGKTKTTVEKFSVVKTLQAIQNSHVVLMLVNAVDGVVEQDLHLLGLTLEFGRSIVIVINKWDGLSDQQKKIARDSLSRSLRFVDFVEQYKISAKFGTGVGKLYPAIKKAYHSGQIKLPAAGLTKILENLVSSHQPPVVKGRRIKLRYCHCGGMNPPIVVVHGNQTERLPSSYIKYLENGYRRKLGVVGTPVRIIFRTGENPYAHKKNQLTQRQIRKKRRLMAHVKK